MDYIGKMTAQAGPSDPWDQPLAGHLAGLSRLRVVKSTYWYNFYCVLISPRPQEALFGGISLLPLIAPQPFPGTRAILFLFRIVMRPINSESASLSVPC